MDSLNLNLSTKVTAVMIKPMKIFRDSTLWERLIPSCGTNKEAHIRASFIKGGLPNLSEEYYL
jgi:hypothetical protein